MNNQDTTQYDANLNKPLDIAFQYDDVLSNPIPAGSAKLGELLDAKISKSGKIIGLRSDWDPFDASRFTHSGTDNLINVSGIGVEDYFQVGDKVEITQGTDKYFYVLAVLSSSNQIRVGAGDDYTFTSDLTTYFAVSRLSNPQGFPEEFNFSPSVYVYEASWSDETADFTGFGSPSLSFSMNGKLATIRYFIATGALDASKTKILVETPLYGTGNLDQGGYEIVALNNGTLTDGENHVLQYTEWADSGVLLDATIDVLYERWMLIVQPTVRSSGQTFSSGTINVIGKVVTEV